MATKTDRPNRALGKVIRKARKDLRMSMRDFADAADIPDHTLVGRLEEGHDVRYSAVQKILKAHAIEWHENGGS